MSSANSTESHTVEKVENVIIGRENKMEDKRR